MNRILRNDEKLKGLAMPELKPIDIIPIADDDILIICAGFEDRAVEAFKRTIALKKRFHLVVINYLPEVRENRLNYIVNICSSDNIPYTVFVYDRENPAGAGDNLNSILGDNGRRFFIDISGMSRLLIVQLLVYLFNKKMNFKNVSIIYSEAKEYPPTKEEVDKEMAESNEDLTKTVMFLSSKVFEVAIVPELASVSMQGQPIRLITFPSFNTEQLVALRSEIHPHCFTFIHGIPLLDENSWRTEAINKLNNIDSIPCKEEYYLSTFFYEHTLNKLIDIYNSYNENEKIVIAPTGSKMQAVAVGIFRSFMEDIQIIYPTPVSFLTPERYTLGVRQIYQLDLDSFQLSDDSH